MIILGLNTFGENPAACLVVDGVLRGFCQEERFTRLKGSGGQFPSQAVSWCLRSQGLRLADVDRIAVSWDCTKYPWAMLRHLAGVRLSLLGVRPGASSLKRKAHHGTLWRYLLTHTPAAFEQGIRDHLRDAGHRGPIPRIDFVPHHDAHAFQAYHQSSYDDAAVLVADGSGEEHTVSGYHFTRGGWRPLFHLEVPQSLGWYYAGFTAYLGFHANRDEGKLMGLAALGTARQEHNPWRERLQAVLRVDEDGFELDPTCFKFAGNEHHPSFSDRLRRFVTAHDPRLEPVAVGETVPGDGGTEQPRYLLPAYADLAFAVQERLELALLAVARRLRRESGSTRLCVAGGVAMNCKANGRLLAESGFGGLFVHPASSDDGAAIGAAFHAAWHEDRLLPNQLSHAQWGPAFTDGEVAAALRGCGIPFTTPPDVAEASAELLAQGRLLGWFQGGMEMGARALGGRSIVAVPNGAETRERVNRQVKFREAWRPYCPSMAAESAGRYLRDPVEAPFMILARHATAELPVSTVHVDGTVRPQTVDAAVLPLWHHLLRSVAAHTGHPVLLNTSFNVRSEPIVCSPHDAIRCFFGSGLDAMAIGGFLIRKPSA